MTEGIGIVGAGRIDAAFARRLVATGHDVTVWNRTPERTAGAREVGARMADSLLARYASSR